MLQYILWESCFKSYCFEPVVPRYNEFESDVFWRRLHAFLHSVFPVQSKKKILFLNTSYVSYQRLLWDYSAHGIGFMKKRTYPLHGNSTVVGPSAAATLELSELEACVEALKGYFFLVALKCWDRSCFLAFHFSASTMPELPSEAAFLISFRQNVSPRFDEKTHRATHNSITIV